ncbi:MAG: hypothetical protein GWP08_18115 [Nitrospiraceae bacterium]|nr:hypothetical protein [Nitrospiraceae bacterium]
MKRRLTTYVLLGAIMATGFAGPRAFLSLDSDANGDRQVNVLDLQVVVADVLSGPSQTGPADVNADGRVDILDLQRILSQAATTDAPEQDAPAEREPKAAPPAPFVPRILATTGRLTADTDHRIAALRAAWPKIQRVVPMTAQTERYLYTLTPHAPPRSA